LVSNLSIKGRGGIVALLWLFLKFIIVLPNQHNLIRVLVKYHRLSFKPGLKAATVLPKLLAKSGLKASVWKSYVLAEAAEYAVIGAWRHRGSMVSQAEPCRRLRLSPILIAPSLVQMRKI
jgi:hypothetical protein